ncbi:hypothetical protein CHS0354_039054 [Potamilus streckersoni]|uniref:Prefoldin subunit 5 n=1 Tax=Potamilus streckersoni TaxID=2493646 RepID=A0AAE0RRK7_9BIVA|nr:hypothetical protein CHS0354_039054 [Potamilus streckersoni]
MTSMAGKQPQLQSIDIQQLQLPQLNAFVQQLEQEIELFGNSMNSLKLAQGKFVESQECLNKVSLENKEKDILVPLTSSMYVPGQLSDVENILVDIGTGYYVEMPVENGKDYFKRKVDYVSKQIEKIQPVLQDKYRMKQVAMEILQSKMQLMQQQAASSKA